MGYYYFDYGIGGNTGWSDPKLVYQAPYFLFAGIKLVESAGKPALFAYLDDHIQWIRAVDAEATAWESPVRIESGYGSVSNYTQPLNSNGRPVLPLNYEGNFNWMAGADELGSAFDFVHFTPGEPVSYWTRGAIMLDGRPATLVADFPDNYVSLKWFPAEDQYGLEWSYPRSVIWFPQPVYFRWLRDVYITDYQGEPYAMLECYLTEDYPYELRSFTLLTTKNGSVQ